MDSTDNSAAKRQAAHKERLLTAGGKRLPLELDGAQLSMLEDLLNKQYGTSQADVLRRALEAEHARFTQPRQAPSPQPVAKEFAMSLIPLLKNPTWPETRPGPQDTRLVNPVMVKWLREGKYLRPDAGQVVCTQYQTIFGRTYHEHRDPLDVTAAHMFPNFVCIDEYDSCAGKNNGERYYINPQWVVDIHTYPIAYGFMEITFLDGSKLLTKTLPPALGGPSQG